MNKIRESNFELLRIFAIVGVVVLHSSSYFFQSYENNGLFWNILFHILHAIFIPSVNVFLIITGYFMCNKNSVSVKKPILLYIQNTIFFIGLYVVSLIKADKIFSIKSMVFRFLPSSWFLVIYIVLFLIIPFINIGIVYLKKKYFKLFLGVCLFFFSFYATGIDIIQSFMTRIQINGGGELIGYSPIGQKGSQEGYTIVNFVLMYLCGGYIRKTDLELKSKYCLLFILINTFLIFLWIKFDYTVGEEYCNPLVILNAILIFLYFKNMKIQSKIINKFAAACFTVYIFHIPLLFRIPKDFCYGRKLLAISKYCLIVIGIYGICWFVHEIYNATVNRFLDKMIFARHDFIISNGLDRG